MPGSDAAAVSGAGSTLLGVAEWHPILAALERQPGTWEMIDPEGRRYGRTEMRRVADGIRYRAEYDGELLGWFVLGCDLG